MECKGTNTRRRLLGAIGLLTVIACPYDSYVSAQEQESAPKRAAAKLTCGSHSSNPQQHKAFQVDLQFDVSGSLWMLDWKTERAEVKFRGIRSPSGAMLIAGLGKSDEGATWTYEFSGHKNPTGIAVLKGSSQSEQPKGMRSCSTFQNKQQKYRLPSRIERIVDDAYRYRWASVRSSRRPSPDNLQ